MIAKKVIRYYADCGRGFWKKQKALTHDKNCQCWVNEKHRTCLTCKHKNFAIDSNGMEHDPQYLQTWVSNECCNQNGIPAHENAQHIIKNCLSWEPKIKKS